MKEESQGAPGDNGITYIEATNADVLSCTKTTIIDDGRIFWNPCDQIGVYFGYNYANYSSCNMEPAQTARFVCKDISLTTGSHAESKATTSDDVIWGVSPYLCANQDIGEFVDFKESNEPNPLTRSKDGIKVYHPEIQNAVDNSFDPLAFISVARSRDCSKLSFYNLGGCIRFKLTRRDIDMVVLQGHNDEILAGVFEVSTDSSEQIPVIKSSQLTSPVIRLGKIYSDIDEEDGKYYYGDYYEPYNDKYSPYLNAGVWYYICVPPTIFSKGYSLSFISHQSNTFATMRIDTPVTLDRSQIISFDNVDASLSYSDYDGNLECGNEFKMKLTSVTKLDNPEDLNCDGVIEPEEEYLLSFTCENNADFKNDIERLGGIHGYANKISVGKTDIIIQGASFGGDTGSLFFHYRKTALNNLQDLNMVYNTKTGESHIEYKY